MSQKPPCNFPATFHPRSCNLSIRNVPFNINKKQVKPMMLSLLFDLFRVMYSKPTKKGAFIANLDGNEPRFSSKGLQNATLIFQQGTQSHRKPCFKNYRIDDCFHGFCSAKRFHQQTLNRGSSNIHHTTNPNNTLFFEKQIPQNYTSASSLIV